MEATLGLLEHCPYFEPISLCFWVPTRLVDALFEDICVLDAGRHQLNLLVGTVLELFMAGGSDCKAG